MTRDKLIKRDACLKQLKIWVMNFLIIEFLYMKILDDVWIFADYKFLFFYDIFGYRFNRYNQGKARDNSSNNKKILAMINCILLYYYYIN